MNLKHLLGLLLLASATYSYTKAQTALSLLDKPAPLFKAQAVLPDGTVDTFNLKDHIGENIVIYFFPMDNSPRCTIQAKKFRDEIARLHKKNILVIGISNDSIKSHQKFQKNLGLPYPLIADSKQSIAKKYKAHGFFVEQRITFLVNQDGIVFKVFDKVDIKNQIDDIVNAFEEHA